MAILPSNPNDALGEGKRPVGRPPVVGGRRVQVYLDDKSLATAARLGDGNVSEGIRQALKGASGSCDDVPGSKPEEPPAASTDMPNDRLMSRSFNIATILILVGVLTMPAWLFGFADWLSQIQEGLRLFWSDVGLPPPMLPHVDTNTPLTMTHVFSVAMISVVCVGLCILAMIGIGNLGITLIGRALSVISARAE